jgi:hypothetical protein
MLDTTALDPDVAVLRSSAREWVTTPLAEKRRLLEAVRGATAAVADEWVRLSCQGKGIAPSSPAAGEEWTSGPYALLADVAALIRLVRDLEAGANPLDRIRARTLPGGRVALRVVPAAPEDRLGAGLLRAGVAASGGDAGAGEGGGGRHGPGRRPGCSPRSPRPCGDDRAGQPSLRWSQLDTRVGRNRIPTRLAAWRARPARSSGPGVAP